jgi:2,4-didehydro-3-deoxy-L-rhamnonate hydrolase
MRIASFGEVGRERPGIVRGDEVLDLRAARPRWPQSWRGILEAGLWNEVDRAAAEAPKVSLSQVRLGPPIPDPSKIVALGLNYRDHALEQKKEPPAVPLLFAKAPSCLIGPNDPIRLPDPALEDQVDAEAELCLVIGRGGKEITESGAWDHILGYTIMNDVSGRRAQYGDKQWFRGKSFDTFGPCGPWIVTRDELPDPSGLAIEADWGDRPMQRGNTSDLIFPVPFIVSYVSRMMTLRPGDLITTGTPAGVGVFRDPPVFLRRGEHVTVRLSGVGSLANPVE